MKKSKTLLSMLAAASFAVAPFSHAVTTDPVGYVTVTVNANSDLKAAITLTQTPTFTGSASSVTEGTVDVSGTIGDVTTERHFALVTSGNLAGQWFEITTSTPNSFTVEEDLEAEGLAASDSLRVFPFWTLATLLPNGGGLPVTTDPSDIQGFVLTNDPSATGTNLPTSGTFFYLDNGSITGWFDGGGVPADDFPLSPDTYITLRNLSDSTADVVVTGAVPTSPIGSKILSRSAGEQDNQVPNPYPAELTLGASQLFEDGVVRATTDPNSVLDFILVYPSTADGLNPATTSTYFYFDNGTISGYFDGGGNPADSAIIPAGAAVVIRRGVGLDEISNWTPPVPYTFN